jgi:prophage regulatory protein
MSIKPTEDRLIRYPEAVKIVGISRPTIWRLIKKGEFPAPRVISAGAVGFSLSELHEFIGSRQKRAVR